MKKIILLILSLIILNGAFGQVNEKKALGKVKVSLPDKKYYSKVENQFYEKIWLDKSIYEFNSFYDFDKNDEFEPKKMKFYYVPEFVCKNDAQKIKKGQDIYDFFELDTTRSLFLMKYNNKFIGEIRIDYNKRMFYKNDSIFMVTPSIENDSVLKYTVGLYTEYEKRKGKVFLVYPRFGAKFWYVDTLNTVWVFDPFDQKQNIKTAYEYINENIEEIKYLTDRNRKEIIIR